MVSSNVANRYEYYLRHFHHGSFADIATVRIKELRTITQKASVVRDDGATAKKKKNSRTSKTPKPQTSVKVAALATSAQKTEGFSDTKPKTPSVDGISNRGLHKACTVVPPKLRPDVPRRALNHAND
jgi:hypothetical protein